ncbi:hypothetical protein O6H91_21G052800 [Diphasiastrum complanatum]|uniref:Uncharacterized protein n=1 Tax=Diphasiastrum complanatum TaxID=34168 RepID=A0ACC2AKH6_DIPCM|nr:hypothetical protein O6H91_21G052800 [Diphasiastrum complanatum]
MECSHCINWGFSISAQLDSADSSLFAVGQGLLVIHHHRGASKVYCEHSLCLRRICNFFTRIGFFSNGGSLNFIESLYLIGFLSSFLCLLLPTISFIVPKLRAETTLV